MIQAIGLSIVNACNANCVFCPRDMIPTKGKKMMTLQTIKKIMAEITSPKFKKKHDVSHIVVGENGEPTLHKDLISILREIKKSGIAVSLFTNFSNMDANRAKIIVDENLVSSVNTNIDGNTPETYKKMKGLDFVKIMTNLENFLALPGREAIPVYIHNVTMEIYAAAVNKYYGKTPRKLPIAKGEIQKDEHKLIAKRFLNYPNVVCSPDSTLMWAEKYSVEKKDGDYACWNLGRIYNNAFINPDGDWYICCFDMGNEQVIGNINEESLDTIYNGKKRAELIKKLENKEFDAIGSPCNRVDCCQVVPWG